MEESGSFSYIHSKRFRLRGKTNPTFALQVAEAFSKALFCLCVWESCMAICGHLVSVRRRRENDIIFHTIRLIVVHQHWNWGYISNEN